MATVAAIQAALDATGKGPTIARGPIRASATLDEYFVFGGVGVKVPSGEGRWVQTNTADAAATQAAAMVAALS